MFTRLIVATFLGGLLSIQGGSVSAQPLSESDITIRPGDVIEWTTPGIHHLLVGAEGLTALSDVDKILSFSPELNREGFEGFSNAGASVTATVKADAGMQGVQEFVFTCGAHPTGMLSRPFKIAEGAGDKVRTLKIRAENPETWILTREDGSEVAIDTTPPD
jgi:hypothetical protein